MKKVLITGANSYIGTNVEQWLLKEPDKYHVETLDMKDQNWINFDFSKFDVVFHVAGIAHSTPKKSEKDLYYKVNTQLTIETAKKSKESGVKQFIFMSSMIVYNKKEKRITKDTLPKPDNFYGDSKLQAENGIKPLEDKKFTVTILRPPMIYGPNSKGNFPRLIKLTKKTFIFPKIQNKRSMLYVDNLSNSVKHLIDNKMGGIYYPQNRELISTTKIVKTISNDLNKKMIFTRLFNLFIYPLTKFTSTFNKLFSDSYYDLEMSKNIINLSIISFEQSIHRIVSDE